MLSRLSQHLAWVSRNEWDTQMGSNTGSVFLCSPWCETQSSSLRRTTNWSSTRITALKPSPERASLTTLTVLSPSQRGRHRRAAWKLIVELFNNTVRWMALLLSLAYGQELWDSERLSYVSRSSSSSEARCSRPQTQLCPSKAPPKLSVSHTTVRGIDQCCISQQFIHF